MKYRKWTILGMIALGMAFVFFGGASMGKLIERDMWRAAALEAGVAEWRCDPVTGEKEFVWTTSK